MRPVGIFGHYGMEARAKKFDEWRASLSESQTEPTAAEVEAAGQVLYGISWGTDIADPDLVHAALRAAAETTKSEETR